MPMKTPKKLEIEIDELRLPAPKKGTSSGRPPMEYPFEEIPIGGSARFPRAKKSVQTRMTKYKRSGGEGRFVIRALSAGMTRVWRLE